MPINTRHFGWKKIAVSCLVLTILIFSKNAALAADPVAVEVTAQPEVKSELSTNRTSTGSVNGNNFAGMKVCGSGYQGVSFLAWEALATNSLLVFWDDIFVRYNINSCHYFELENLMNKMDQLRAQMRKAWAACDNNTTFRLTQQYKELNLELFYLRNFAVINFISGPDLNQEAKDRNIYLKPNFKPEFINAAKRVGLGEQQSNTLFEKFSGQYKGKISEFQNCPSFLTGGIGQIATRLKNITKNVDTLMTLSKKFADRVTKRAENTQARIQSNPGIAPFNSIFNSGQVSGIWKRLVEIRINGDNISSNENINITGATRPNILSSNNRPESGYSLYQANEDIILNQQDDEVEQLDAKFYAEYELKYRLTNDAGLRDRIDSLVRLEKIIKDEIVEKQLPLLKNCTESIIKKQCENKPITLE